jgi:hypothetical protein
VHRGWIEARLAARSSRHPEPLQPADQRFGPRRTAELPRPTPCTIDRVVIVGTFGFAGLDDVVILGTLELAPSTRAVVGDDLLEHRRQCPRVDRLSLPERDGSRGLGTGVTAALLHDALARGCATASLQATPMAERLYVALGFRDVGRILEYAPAASPGHGANAR